MALKYVCVYIYTFPGTIAQSNYNNWGDTSLLLQREEVKGTSPSLIEEEILKHDTIMWIGCPLYLQGSELYMY